MRWVYVGIEKVEDKLSKIWSNSNKEFFITNFLNGNNNKFLSSFHLSNSSFVKVSNLNDVRSYEHVPTQISLKRWTKNGIRERLQDFVGITFAYAIISTLSLSLSSFNIFCQASVRKNVQDNIQKDIWKIVWRLQAYLHHRLKSWISIIVTVKSGNNKKGLGHIFSMQYINFDCIYIL